MKTFNLHKFIVVLAAVLAPYIACARPIPPQVKTQSGWVEGNEAGGLQVFLGIPYAAPPVGELRWKPPVPAAKWKNARKATHFGARCMQKPVFGDMAFRMAGDVLG